MTESTRSDSGRFDRCLEWALNGTALAAVAFHAVIPLHPIFGELMNQNAHLGFCFTLLLLYFAIKAKTRMIKGLLLGTLLWSLFLVIHMAVNYERLDMWGGFPEPFDVVVGICLILLVLVLVWKQWGGVFPVLALIGVAYAVWGHHLPGLMGHPPLEFGFIISNLSVGFQGIYGMMLSISVNVVFILIIFGSLFQATGVDLFFKEFGSIIARYLRGGAGQTAVFSSSLVGMVNGAAVANVAITGSYTIPMMKRSGFRGETAAAIEAVASTGGLLTPPIMGIAIFIMANFLGLSYADLMMKAVPAAICYYAVASIGVAIIARREHIPKLNVPVNRKNLIAGAPVFLLPMVLLTLMLLRHYSPGYTAVVSIACILIVAVFRKETRPSLRVLKRVLVQGSILGANLGMAIACIGMFTKLIMFTGASTKLTLAVLALSGGHLLPGLVMTMALSIFLSCAMPAVVAYVVVALVVAPILKDMGLSLLAAHFFVYFFAMLSAITPPVAGATMVGSQIAQVRYMKAGWEGFKLVAPFFLVPFFAVYNPVLLLGEQPAAVTIQVFFALVIATGAIICFCQNFCLHRLNRGEKSGFLVMALVASAYGLLHVSWLFYLMCGFVIMLGTLQWRKRKSDSTKERRPKNGAMDVPSGGGDFVGANSNPNKTL